MSCFKMGKKLKWEKKKKKKKKLINILKKQNKPVKTWKDPYLIGFDILVNEIYMINRVKYDVVVEKKKKTNVHIIFG